MMSLKAYTNRNIVAYLALSVPALLLQVFFILALLKIPAISFPGVFHYANLAIQFAPWIVLAVSIYAVVMFRPSLLLTLLVLSYFISSIFSGSASLSAAGYFLSTGDIAALVVAASFCSLISFGFSRAARIEKAPARVHSSGPIAYQSVGVFLEIVFPALVAVGLVLATLRIDGALRAETLLFPSPLNTIFAEFVVSPVIVLITAALTLTLVKDLVEPWILYYTINKEDAIKYIEKDVKQMETVRGFTGRLASGGMLFSIIAVVIILAVIVFAFGTKTLLANLGPVFFMGKPTTEPNFLVSINNGYTQFVNLLNTIFHLLWG